MKLFFLTHYDANDHYDTVTTNLGLYQTHEEALAALERARKKYDGDLWERGRFLDVYFSIEIVEVGKDWF